MAKAIIVDQIRFMSQDEGLNDTEIGDKLGYTRGAIQRIRKENGIPVANKLNRKDKTIKCLKCDKIIWVRRSEDTSKIFLCDTCSSQDNSRIQSMYNDKFGE